MCELPGDKMTRATATERRDDGIAKAIDHADRVSHAWSVLAYQYVQWWLRHCKPDATFLSENIIGFATEWGAPEPPDSRAWGAIIQRAARAGLIVKAGYREDKFCSPKTLWRRA